MPDCQIVFSIALSDWQQDYIKTAALQFYWADLPELFNGSQETENCLGAALQAAYKMVKLPVLYLAEESILQILFIGSLGFALPSSFTLVIR